MKKNNYLHIIILIVISILTILILKNIFTKMENFINIDDINNEMVKQLNIINDTSDKNINNQINTYLPHFDVINSYKNNSKIFLDSIKNNISKHKEKKEDELNKLDNSIFRLSKYKNDNVFKQLKNSDFKSIKSHNNGLNLSVKRIGYDIYQIMVNNGCLKVTPENDYLIVPPDVNDKGQHFRFEHIFNEVEYRNRMSKAFPQLMNLGKVHYPFTLIRSKITNNCLKNHHGKLSIEPCREYEGQRWASSKFEQKCSK